jgi:hypothetical protein
MKHRICTFCFSLFLLLLVGNMLVKADCTENIYGSAYLNGHAFQGARIYLRDIEDGLPFTSDVAITGADGSYILYLCDLPRQMNINNCNVVAEYPGISCPNSSIMAQHYFGNHFPTYMGYSFNNNAPSGLGNYSGTIIVNGNPAPYHTTMNFNNGYYQTTDNSGSYNSPTSYPYGNTSLTITVYTQPNVTTSTYSFCFNTPNQIVNPSLSISNFQTGYITGTLKRSSCEVVPNNIVYYRPTIANGMAEGWTVSDANGNFTTYNLPVGNYDIYSTYSGIYRSKTITVQSGLNSGQNLNFGMVCIGKRNIGNQDNEITEFQILQNYPNPFNPSTSIRFNLEKETFVSLKIYDMLGQEVAILVDGIRPGGRNEVVWNGVNKENKSLSAGTYIYSLKVDNIIYNKKMILLK